MTDEMIDALREDDIFMIRSLLDIDVLLALLDRDRISFTRWPAGGFPAMRMPAGPTVL